MIQFNVNGRLLDLPAGGINLQLKKSNPLFAFDSLECERSTSFDVPATPNNDAIFGLAKVIYGTGAGMRVRYVAQLQASGVSKDGYLYVTSFSGGKYKCVFVTGELIGLKRITEAGNIADILQYDAAIRWDDTTPTNANASSLPDVGFVKYNNQKTHLSPSVSIDWLVAELAAKLGVNIAMPQTGARFRIFKTADAFKLPRTRVHITNDPQASQDPVNIEPFLGIVQYSPVTAARWNATAIQDAGGLDWDYDNATLAGTDQFDQIKFPFDVELEFDESTPQDLCVVSGDLCYSYYGGAPHMPLYPVTFLSERRFFAKNDASGDVEYSGRPIAGTKIMIPANTPFMFTNGDGLYMPAPQTLGEQKTVGFSASRVPAFDVSAEFETDHEFIYGEAIPYNALLPNCTAIELLKIIAGVTGLLLNYDNAGGVTFDNLDFSAWDVNETRRIIKRSELVRTFADYAQKNTISFEGNTSVRFFEKLTADYAINNVNIDAEKTLETLKASAGGVTVEDYDGELSNMLIIRADYDYDGDTLGNAQDFENMQRVELPQNNGLNVLCEQSTRESVQIQMNLFAFTHMTPQTLIYSNGIYYAWSDAQWTKDVATLTLNKIAGLQTPEPPVTPMPKPNEVWVWPMSQTPDVGMVQNATLIGTGEINGIKICKYDNPVLKAGRLILTTGKMPSIIIFPEGFQRQNISHYWVFNQYITDLYLPSTFQYLGQQNFRAGIGGYIHNVWLAWNEPQQYIEISTGYDRVRAYHVRAGLKAAYVAAGWPEAKIVEDYEFNPWAQMTRGLAMGFESEEPTPDER